MSSFFGGSLSADKETSCDHSALKISRTKSLRVACSLEFLAAIFLTAMRAKGQAKKVKGGRETVLNIANYANANGMSLIDIGKSAKGQAKKVFKPTNGKAYCDGQRDAC
jgi:hypothetical protein